LKDAAVIGRVLEHIRGSSSSPLLYKWDIKQRRNSQQLGNNNSEEEDQHSGKSGRQDLQVPVINIQNQLIPDNAICVIY